jgi:hypothetical protein
MYLASATAVMLGNGPTKFRKCGTNLQMRAYQFSMRQNGTLEHLGGLAFASDDAAIAFGREVVQDLIKKFSDQYFGGVLVIADSGRAVGDVVVA